ncbi:hypothetical protein L596_024532 [Steinernema carpocapsae]|uniref:Uncharacterized protein n=1 Tax=Steinernema carpocapsae TaxID=34508 RepID=A0A4U5MH18_STECR|nr:hypothetical protein L596_024532 [Steinernema carpocapsae]
MSSNYCAYGGSPSKKAKKTPSEGKAPVTSEDAAAKAEEIRKMLEEVKKHNALLLEKNTKLKKERDEMIALQNELETTKNALLNRISAVSRELQDTDSMDESNPNEENFGH